METEVERLKRELEAARGQSSSSNGRFNQLNNDLNRERSEKANLIQQLRQKDAQISSLNSQLLNARNQPQQVKQVTKLIQNPETTKKLEASQINAFLLACELDRIRTMYIDREKECDDLDVKFT